MVTAWRHLDDLKDPDLLGLTGADESGRSVPDRLLTRVRHRALMEVDVASKVEDPLNRGAISVCMWMRATSGHG